MSAEAAGPGVATTPPLARVFDDNSLLPLLYGHHDCHLALLEDRLGVVIRPRGNEVAIDGSDPAAEQSALVLDHLWARIRNGEAIEPADVDAAVRLVTQAGEDAHGGGAMLPGFDRDDVVIRTRRRRVTPRSSGQARFIQALKDRDMVFGLGPAGTGKTFLAVAQAVSMLEGGRVDRIVLTRPAVEAGERLGFLPGDMRDKLDPYLQPLYDALRDLLPQGQLKRLLDAGTIEIAPLAFMRGRTLERAFVILDEGQNAVVTQMKMALTRLGSDSRMAITGDPSQVDLPRSIRSGLDDAAGRLSGIEDIGFVRLDHRDIVRHRLVAEIVMAYADHDKTL